MAEGLSDEILVRRVQGGDKAAFDLLVHKYQHRVMKLVSRYVYDRSETEDVTQEAFIKAYRALANFRGDSAFYTWLYRIAVNTAKNFLVSANRRPPGSDVDAADAENLSIGQSLRDNDTPEHKFAAEEIMATVSRVMDSLPDELREAITLRELDGLSYEEISQVMECPIGTVRSRIFRAREAIDKEIRPLMSD